MPASIQSQISDFKTIAREIEKELHMPDFAVRAELYLLLAIAANQEARRTVLDDYRLGLEAVAEEVRIEWQGLI